VRKNTTRVSKTAAQCRDRRRADLGRGENGQRPSSNRLFFFSAQNADLESQRPRTPRHSDPRSRATATRPDLQSSATRSDSPRFRPSFRRREGSRLTSHVSEISAGVPIAPIGLFVFPLEARKQIVSGARVSEAH